MTVTEELEFGPLTIRFDERVLRPRPWTLEQSRWAAELLTHLPDGPVLELCSGAGQIGLATVALTPRPLVMVDASKAACELARLNADRAGLEVEIRCVPLDVATRSDEEFALVVADPPWVPSGEITRFPEDPVSAIDGGDDGLHLARQCLIVADARLASGGAVLLQVGPDHVESVTRWLEESALTLVTVESRRSDRGALMLLTKPGQAPT